MFGKGGKIEVDRIIEILNEHEVGVSSKMA
jgi:hypothetical protein